MKYQKDPLFDAAIKQWQQYGQQYDKITISFFQRRLGIGYARAERLVGQLKRENVLSRKRPMIWVYIILMVLFILFLLLF